MPDFIPDHVGIILIGNELLDGSRKDKHMPKVIELLNSRGMSLNWVRIIGDTEDQLVTTFRQTMASNDLVFSFGGIGATPDDLTRTCAAEAAGVALTQHPEAKALIEKQFGEAAYPQRILMSELPEAAGIIPNPINNVPGFSVTHHHFVPGFPDMAWPMVEWVLDTHYSHLVNPVPDKVIRWDIIGVPESDILDTMNELLKHFPRISLSSLPSTEKRGELIDFGLKGQAQELVKAATWLEQQLDRLNIQFIRKEFLDNYDANKDTDE
jgi:molybdopterin-biosynthesis enzyme MoeA-like protein